MAIQEAVNIDVNVRGQNNVKQAGQAFETLNQTTKQTTQGMQSAAKSTTMMGAATGKLRNGLNATAKNFNDLKGQLSAIPGPIGFVIQGMTGLSTAMKVLLANPLGIALTALVGVLYTLKRALTDSVQGQERLNRIMSVTGALFGNVMDIVADFGEALIKAIQEPMQTMRDFADGVEQFIKHPIDSIRNAYNGATESAKEFVEEQKKEIKQADQVAKMRNKATQIEIDLLVERSKLESEIADLRLKSRMEDSVSAADRRKALLDAQELEEQLLEKEVEVLELRRDAQKLENTFSRTNIENARKEAEAEAAVNNIVARRLNLQRATQRELNRVNREIERNNKAEEKRQEKLAEKERKRLEETQEARERIATTQANEAKKQEEERDRRFGAERKATDEHFKKSAQIINTFNEARQRGREKDLEDQKKATETEIQLREQIFYASQDIATAISGILGEQTEIGKAVALAQIAADTARALSGALANANSPTPDNVATGGLAGIAKYITIAATIATNAKRAVDILKSGNVQASAAGGTPSAGLTSMSAPAVRLPRTEQFTGDRRVYVTEYDISNTMEKVKVTEDVSIVK